MTDNEFFDFVDELGACFPMIGKWFAGQDNTVVDKWRSVLVPVTLQESKTLLNEWFASASQPFKESSQWQEIPALIRREAYNRRPKAGTSSTTVTAGPLIRDSRLLEIYRRVKSDPQNAGQTIALYINTLPTDKRDYKRCFTCADYGLVHVWFNDRKNRGVCRCTCEAASKWGIQCGDVFNAQKHCKVITDDPGTDIDIWKGMTNSQRIQAATGRKAIEENDLAIVGL